MAANASALVLMQENEKTFAIGLETTSALIEKQILTPLEELSRLRGDSESPGIDSGTTDDKESESQLWQASQLNNVRIMDYARTPTFPIRPNKKQNAALGLLVGIFLGGGSRKWSQKTCYLIISPLRSGALSCLFRATFPLRKKPSPLNFSSFAMMMGKIMK